MDGVEELWGCGKLILGPMVRASSLPLRAAALGYGADVVYSEEIPAHRAASAYCQRVVNPVLGTVDFLETKHGNGETLVLFRTHAETEVAPRRCVLQLGTSNATTALRAARLFERDVAAIDINMGCAKHYSVSRGMGSALMDRPEVAEDIVKTLRRNLSIPVSIKTRIFDSIGGNCCNAVKSNDKSAGRSVEWLQRLQKCGAQAIVVHMRTASEKNRDLAHSDLFGLLHSHMRCTNTPLVYNGDIWSHSDIEKVKDSIRTADGLSTEIPMPEPAVMVCRAGLWNPSVFAQLKAERARSQQNGDRSARNDNTGAVNEVALSDLLVQIVKLSAEAANCPLNTRYLLQQVLAGARKLDSDVRHRIVRSGNLTELAEALDISEYVQAERERQRRGWSEHSLSYKTEGTEHTGSITCIDTPPLDRDSATTTGAQPNKQPANIHDAGGPHPRATATQRPRGNLLNSYFNAQHWPGIVSRTSHEYNDRYFDDNYYVAFARPQSAVLGVGAAFGAVPVKKAFTFSGFTQSNTTVVRVKRKATEVTE